jgi:S1-C subfamily serine protease
MSINTDGQFEPEPPQAPEPAPRKSHKPLLALAIATAAVVCIGGLGTAAVAELTAKSATATNSTATPSLHSNGTFGRGGGLGQSGGGFQGGQQQSASTESAATPATAAQEAGLVTINTVLNYDKGEQAAGTGMILTSSGYILTNNHVVESSTSISVTVESTGKTYTAVVVGTDKTADVAVLKLVGASGLDPVAFAPKEKVTVGESIYSVGNAEGTGTLVTAVGTVGAVDQSLTVGSDSSDASENLTGLIELESDVVSGDSGGALFDKSGDVIGIVTAASSGSVKVTGYAINIAQVLKIADAIEDGTSTSDIVIGYPAFLGIGLSAETPGTGVPVASVFPGTPAALAGLAAGDLITGVNGQAVTTADGLTAAVQSHRVGDQVTIDWTDTAGTAHTSVVTLTAGPAA